MMKPEGTGTPLTLSRVQRAFNTGEAQDCVSLVLHRLEADLRTARDRDRELALVVCLRLAPPITEILAALRREAAGRAKQARLKASIHAAESVEKLLKEGVQ
jgi:hypothetical protein